MSGNCTCSCVNFLLAGALAEAHPLLLCSFKSRQPTPRKAACSGLPLYIFLSLLTIIRNSAPRRFSGHDAQAFLSDRRRAKQNRVSGGVCVTRRGAVAVSPCSTADGPRRSSGTITGGAIPTPLLNLGLSERESVAHCTWAVVSVMYCGPEGQRTRAGPADTSLTLWNAAPHRSPVAKGLPWLAAAAVLRLMRIFFHYFGALVRMEMFILVLCCGAWGKWLIQRCALLSPAPRMEIFFDVCKVFNILSSD